MSLKYLYSFNFLPDNGKCLVTLRDSVISRLSGVTPLVTELTFPCSLLLNGNRGARIIRICIFHCRTYCCRCSWCCCFPKLMIVFTNPFMFDQIKNLENTIGTSRTESVKSGDSLKSPYPAGHPFLWWAFKRWIISIHWVETMLKVLMNLSII